MLRAMSTGGGTLVRVNSLDLTGGGITSLLHSHSLSQAARQLGVTKQCVSLWRQGKVKPPRMAELFAQLILYVQAMQQVYQAQDQ